MGGFTCDIEIATRYTPAEICTILRDNLPFVTGEAEYDPRFPRTLFTTNESLQIDFLGREDPELTEETFGFRPTVMISFEQAKYTRPDDPLEGRTNMIHAVNWIINHLDGDLVFLAGREVPALLRRNGHIWLDNKDRVWIPDDFQYLTFPYEWKKLPRCDDRSSAPPCGERWKWLPSPSRPRRTRPGWVAGLSSTVLPRCCP